MLPQTLKYFRYVYSLEENTAHKIEAKIKGMVARLFSSKNDYVFDIFSKDGLH